MHMATRILTFGHDPSLLRTREMLLSRDGFEVVSATEGAEATRLFSEQHVDLLILCHTLREQECESMLSLTHTPGHETKALVLRTPTSSFIDAGTHPVMCIIDGPSSLLATVHHLTDHSQPLSQAATS